MRVISGKYKGRKLSGFDIVGTRPTMDRVKESMFAMIQDDTKEAVVLDLFAGTGALGIEALSNGAKICYFVDYNPIAIKTIMQNTSGIENKRILKMDYLEALHYFYKQKIKFSIILLDPPYHKNLLNHVLQKVKEYDLLMEQGLLVCEYEEGNIESPFSLVKEKEYGEKKIKIFRK